VNDDGESKRNLGGILLAALDKAVDVQWARAQQTVTGKRRRSPGATNDEIAALIVLRDMTAIGGTSGGLAAIPGPLTVARVTVGLTVETTVLFERSAYMALAVAHAYDHDLTELQVRKYAIVRVLGVWTGATDGLLGFSAAVAQGLGKKAVSGIPKEAVFAFNRVVGKRVLVKWGTKSGAVRLGSVVPFGIGIGLGAGGNYVMARGLGRAAINEFRPPVATRSR
jgi:hypothetical protein